MYSTVLAATKAVRLGLHLLRGMAIVTWRFPVWSDSKKSEQIVHWSKQLLGLIAIDLEVHGNSPQQGPLLLVVNHISWLDIVVLLASGRYRFVAKTEIGHWPMLGSLTRAVDTLFIQRSSRRDVLRVVQRMANALQPGNNVVLTIFPEGTTSNGLQVLPFHANLFQAALLAHAPVQTLALRFEDATTGHSSQAAAYINADTLLASIWRTLKSPRLRVKLHFGNRTHGNGRSRQQWAADAHAEIVGLLERADGASKSMRGNVVAGGRTC